MIDITDFGAVGDGSTPCSEAIQDAIDSLTNGGVVYVPAGVYLIDTSISQPSNVLLRGEWSGVSIFKQSSAHNILNSANVSNIGVIDLGFLGVSGGANGIIYTNINGFQIKDCKLNVIPGDGMIVRDCCGWVVRNEVDSPGGHGIALADTNGIGRFVKCSLNHIQNPVNSGINVSGQKSASVVGNTIEHDGAGGMHVTGYAGIRFSNGSTRCTATGNTIKGMTRGVFFVTGCGDGNIASANTIIDSGNQGILSQADSQIITSNTVLNSGKEVDSPGIRVASGDYNTVSDNRIHGDGDMDIGIDIAGQNNSINDNILSGYTNTAITNSGTNYYSNNH